MLSGKVLLQGLPLAVLWEDQHIFCINKPALAHSIALGEKTSSAPASIAAALLDAMPSLSSVSLHPGDAGLVQRLDFETSGVLVGAKSQAAWKALRDQFSAASVKKQYVALLEGHLEDKKAIDAPIGSPYRRGSKVRVYLPDRPTKGIRRAQPARTEFAPIKTIPSHVHPHGWSLACAHTSTGRRHQVRAHAAALGFPLVGDSLYRASSDLRSVFGQTKDADEIPAFILHAEKVALLHPESGLPLSITAPPPKYLSLLGLSTERSSADY